MKVKRVKGAKRILNFYKNSFGIFEPYQIIVDLTFCHAALLGKVLIKEQLPKYLDANVQLVTTKCVIEEGKALGPQLNGAVSIAKRFQVRLCGHKKKAIPAAECIKTMIGTNNSKRYFVATQDRELQEHLETTPGVPVLYLNHNCIVLEKATSLSCTVAQEPTQNLPESQSFAIVMHKDKKKGRKCRICKRQEEKANNEIQDSKVDPSSQEKESLARLKTTLPEEEKKLRRKRKRPGGPNPLSMMKKKRKTEQAELSINKRQRIRKRNRGKKSEHVHVEQELRERVAQDI